MKKITLLKKMNEGAVYLFDVEVVAVQKLCEQELVSAFRDPIKWARTGGGTKIELSELSDDLKWREMLNSPQVAGHSKTCWMFAYVAEAEIYHVQYLVDELETGSGRYLID